MSNLIFTITQERAQTFMWLWKDRGDFADWMVYKKFKLKDNTRIAKTREDWKTFHDRKWDFLRNWITIIAIVTTWIALIIQMKYA